MQELRPRDMSLPERVAILERSLERERNKRKILQELVFEIMDKQPLVRMKLTDEGKDALAELEA